MLKKPASFVLASFRP